MEREVEVAADVDEEEELSRVFKFVNLLYLHGLILGESLEAARELRAHQGFHEAEVSYGGEGDLHRHYTRCKQNPGHKQFIPVNDFKMVHLPPGYRKNVIYDWIMAHADVTCRLLVSYTSKNRPKCYPGRPNEYPFYQNRGKDWMRVGTGWMDQVSKYTEKDNTNCECQKCRTPGTEAPYKVWLKVAIQTACHVVFDDDEARRTQCHFGYDTSTTLLRQCLKLKDLRFESRNIVGDWCRLTYVTHDVDIIEKLYKMCYHLLNQFPIGLIKNTPLVIPKPGPVVIISHPHGCSKQISVGMWTHVQRLGGRYRDEDCERWNAEKMDTTYTYNAATCPGSSGAPVFRLQQLTRHFLCDLLFHSEGSKSNNN